jgi:small subunit ribosomal protein S8
MSRDVIGDFLTVIRNGVFACKDTVSTPYSNLKYHIANLLKQEGFIHTVQITGDGVQKQLQLGLRYVDGESVIHEIVRVSKPSGRVYRGVDAVKPVIGGLGVSILTTNKGVMTHRQAKKLRLGGEVLCTIW